MSTTGPATLCGEMAHAITQEVIEAVEALAGTDPTTADTTVCAVLVTRAQRVRSWLDAVEARVTSRVTELYETAGGAPAAAEHTRNAGVSAAESRRRQQRSATIGRAAQFGDALAEGRIGAEHIDALASATARLDTDIADTLFNTADTLVDAAASMTPEQFARHVRDQIRTHERNNGLERNTRQRRDTYLNRHTNITTGMIEGRFAFHPELANRIFGAVDLEIAAMIANGNGERPDRNRLAAEALGHLVTSGHQHARPTIADITVIIDADTLTTGELHQHSISETSDGLPLPPADIARLLCGGVVTPIIIDPNGNILDAGRTIRHANRTQRRALRTLYRTCAFHGCDTPFNRCEIHHIHHWEHHGPTNLDNLIPLCSHHYHFIY